MNIPFIKEGCFPRPCDVVTRLKLLPRLRPPACAACGDAILIRVPETDEPREVLPRFRLPVPTVLRAFVSLSISRLHRPEGRVVAKAGRGLSLLGDLAHGHVHSSVPCLGSSFFSGATPAVLRMRFASASR